MSFLTINQTAETLGFSRDWVYRTINADPTFPARRLRGHWRVDADKLQTWIDNQPGSGPQAIKRRSQRKYQINIPDGATYSPF